MSSYLILSYSVGFGSVYCLGLLFTVLPHFPFLFSFSFCEILSFFFKKKKRFKCLESSWLKEGGQKGLVTQPRAGEEREASMG